MRAMVVKEFRELRRDRRTVAMLVGMPLLLLVVFGFAAQLAELLDDHRTHGNLPGVPRVVARSEFITR